MPDHDMSQTACVTRAQRQAEHDEMLQRIIVLEKKAESLLEIILLGRKMSHVNRDSIMTLSKILEEHTKCLKQDS